MHAAARKWRHDAGRMRPDDVCRRRHLDYEAAAAAVAWKYAGNEDVDLRIVLTRRDVSTQGVNNSTLLSSLSLSLSLSHSVCLGVDYWKSRDDREAEQQLTRRQKQATVT